MAGKLPRVVVWDLDGCVWDPEMYQLWGGGAPFLAGEGGNLVDVKGQNVRLIGDVRQIMAELHSDPKWANTTVACASCCDEVSAGLYVYTAVVCFVEVTPR